MKTSIIVGAALAVLSLSAPGIATANKVQTQYVLTEEKEVKFTEIKVDEIPEQITATLKKDYAGYVTDKAFKGDDGTFKIKVSKEALKQVLIFNNKGEVLKVEVSEL
jgi:hypothetical protein